MKTDAQSQLRDKFTTHLIHTDNEGKTYLDEHELFDGPQKITPPEFNVLITLKPPIIVDYVLRDKKEHSLIGNLFSFQLPIEQTLAVWTILAAGMFYTAPKDQIAIPVFYGFFGWFAIEQLYHRAGHLTVSTEGQMRFVYHLHWKHHLEPDRPNNTVSPIVKNLVLAMSIYCFFQLMNLPNPLLALAVLTLQYAFYEYTHWLSHTKKANEVLHIPFIGRMLSDIIGHHREHHRIGDRYAVSSGSIWRRLNQQIENKAVELIPKIFPNNAP